MKKIIISISIIFITTAGNQLKAQNSSPQKMNQSGLGMGVRYIHGPVKDYSGWGGITTMEIIYSRNIMEQLYLDTGICFGSLAEHLSTNGAKGVAMVRSVEPFLGVHYDLWENQKINPYASTGIKYAMMRIINKDDHDNVKHFKRPGIYGGFGLSINFKYAKLIPMLQYDYIPITINNKTGNGGGLGIELRAVFIF